MPPESNAAAAIATACRQRVLPAAAQLLAVSAGHTFATVNALRKQAGGKGFYTSNTIIGQDATLAEYCDAIAAAGYLGFEPGTVSYGLGPPCSMAALCLARLSLRRLSLCCISSHSS